MSRIAFNAQYLCDYLKFFSVFTLNFESHATANVGKPTRQVNESTFRTHILCHTVSNDV
jgi:hypothetical protein